jgi:preprotein translocase subunit YajC
MSPLIAQAAEPSFTPTLLMFAALFAIMYFLIWRPQKKREEERQEMLKRLKKNDHVVTSGGIHGVVTSVKDDEVTLKVDEAQNVKIRFARSAIAGIVGEGEMPPVGEDRPK